MRAALNDNSPIYLQVKEAIEEEILSGALMPDEQIPSNRQLVKLWEVNPMTVLKGVGLLADEGILYKKRGEGMFVALDAKETLKRRLGESFRAERLEPVVRLADSLGMPLSELLKQVQDVWEGIHND
ncbi:MAG: GntR family transcriptional regulator [Clostridiales bacterium]|jgi:DNA-binding transcriptional regulator YhcF (GntR family)|nr:GntR family transcriptional regulator [Clostridiales bacterium]